MHQDEVTFKKKIRWMFVTPRRMYESIFMLIDCKLNEKMSFTTIFDRKMMVKMMYIDKMMLNEAYILAEY